LQKTGGDRQKLQTLIEDTNKALEGKACSPRLSLTAEGKVAVIDHCDSFGIFFDPASGKAEVRQFGLNANGSIQGPPGDLLDANVHGLFSYMGGNLVFGTNNASRDSAQPQPKFPDTGKQHGSPEITPYIGPMPRFPSSQQG
jgi:hypothetical protein